MRRFRNDRGSTLGHGNTGCCPRPWGRCQSWRNWFGETGTDSTTVSRGRGGHEHLDYAWPGSAAGSERAGGVSFRDFTCSCLYRLSLA